MASDSSSHSHSGYSSAASSAATSDEEEDDDTAPSWARMVSDPLLSRVQAQPCALVAVSESLSVRELKRRLKRALVASGAHPPYQPGARLRPSLPCMQVLTTARHPPFPTGARLRPSLPASRIRLYTKRGSTAIKPLRDDDELGTALAGGAVDKEVALQLVRHEELLSEGAVLVGVAVLDATGSPAHSMAILVPGEWNMQALLDQLSLIVGTPLDCH
jgi:hypothetical protein